MENLRNDPLLQVETTCGSLLCELQIIWDEVGESDTDRDAMLFELEQECLEVYRRKVDLANRSRAQLRQEIAASEAQLAAICSTMGERPVHIRQADQSAGSLKEELQRIIPQLEEMKKRRSERKNQFLEVLEQIQNISNEISGSVDDNPSSVVVDESDLSSRKLEELHRQLNSLQSERNYRLKQIQSHLEDLDSLCLVLGADFKLTAAEVHPSFKDSECPRSISNNTIEQLSRTVQNLREVKLQRMKKLQDLVITMLELWNLMDTPIEEQQPFQSVTTNIAASEHEITKANSLSLELINYVEAEVSRLDEVKSSKMKELVFKKRSELEDICRRTHLIPEADSGIDYAIEAVESGAMDPANVLEQIELQITNAKEEAFSRKDVLEKIEKWMAACEEECWLEEYNRDDNRYSAGRGAHLTLKRAEKARSLVNKLPGMVEALASKAIAWEKERGIEFLYDGISLLTMLEEYTILRQEKEEERRRLRDQKKLQGQLIAEQEVLYGSKPSPSKPHSVKKVSRVSMGGASNRRLSLGGANIQTPRPDSMYSTKATPRPTKITDRSHRNELNPRQEDGFAVLSRGRRGLDIAGLPTRNHSLGNYREPESPTTRKPFSPISSTAASKVNINNVLEDPNTLRTNDQFFTTPSKTSSIANEENRTPKTMPIPLPSTPATISMPMQTAITPAYNGVNLVHEVPAEIEYSFEERRFGFVVTKAGALTTVDV